MLPAPAAESAELPQPRPQPAPPHAPAPLLPLWPRPLPLGRTAHRHPERAQQSQPLEVAARRSRNRNRQALHLLDLVEIEFGKNRMFLQAERVVATPVESLVAHSAEVAHARQRDINQPIEKLPHLFAPQRDHHANRHPLAQLEIRYGLARAGQHRLLPGYYLELFERRVQDFHIVARFLQRHVNRDLLQAAARASCCRS